MDITMPSIKVQSGSKFVNKERNATGTIGAIMCEQKQGDCPVWIVTVGHTFYSNVQATNQPISRNNCRVETYYQSGVNEMLLGKNVLAAMENLVENCDENLDAQNSNDESFIDLAIIQLDSRLRQAGAFSMEIPGMTSQPTIFSGQNSFLLGRRVLKTGARTGMTVGRIINACIPYGIQGCLRQGLFVVEAECEGQVFAEEGDSGSLIIDSKSSEIIGLLSAVYPGMVQINGLFYCNVAFCIRMDKCLRLAEEKWGKILSFNEMAMREPVNERPVSTSSQDYENKRNNFLADANQFTDEYQQFRELCHQMQLKQNFQCRHTTCTEACNYFRDVFTTFAAQYLRLGRQNHQKRKDLEQIEAILTLKKNELEKIHAAKNKQTRRNEDQSNCRRHIPSHQATCTEQGEPAQFATGQRQQSTPGSNPHRNDEEYDT